MKDICLRFDERKHLFVACEQQKRRSIEAHFVITKKTLNYMTYRNNSTMLSKPFRRISRVKKITLRPNFVRDNNYNDLFVIIFIPKSDTSTLEPDVFLFSAQGPPYIPV